MSEENVEVVRRVIDAAARRDTATVLDLYAPDAEWDASRSAFGELMGRRVYHGHEGLRTFWREWYEAWESVQDDWDELIDAGKHVVGVVTNRGRGRSSGAEVELTQHLIWTIRGGKIVRVVFFPSREEALKAVGLSE